MWKKLFNKYRNISNNRVSVELTQHKRAIVSRESWGGIKHNKFYAAWSRNTRTYYARTRIGNKSVFMHLLIKPSRRGYVTDHIDGDTLNNCDDNLDPNKTPSENSAKKKKDSHWRKKPTTSKYKGVSEYFYNGAKKYSSRICIKKISYHLGYFIKEIDAAKHI